mmetsp:Transcript_101528/g.293848  ORF Transcript_101528/g.293848 Transcript_101528/m.293848 type:complete len:985 (-) Transcript_101528:175-3129(-)
MGRINCRGLKNFFLAVVLTVLCISLIILVLPFLWSAPFGEESEGRCGHIVRASLAVPCLAFRASAISLCTLVTCVGEDGSVLIWGLLIGSPSAFIVFVLVIMSIVLLFVTITSSCDGDEKTFAISVNAMVLAAAAPWYVLLDKPVCMRIRRKCKCETSRVPRALVLLRDACALGDGYVVDLLLDIEGRRNAIVWRLRRCLFLGCCLWQCQPSPRRPAVSTSKTVARASMDTPCEDDDSSTAVHYLALGRWHAAASRHRHHGVFRFWQGATLPAVTDRARARLFTRLVRSGHITPDALIAGNARGRTPLHCAALSGSKVTLRTIFKHIQESGVEDHDALQRKDSNGDTPLEVALRGGQIEIARVFRDLAARPASWVGLSKVDTHRKQVLTCLEALAMPALAHTMATETEVGGPQKVLEGDGEVLMHFQIHVATLQKRIGEPLPDEAAQALLRHHDFDVTAAVRAYLQNPQEALAAAGLQGVLPVSSSDLDAASSTLQAQRESICIVCMEPAGRSLLACGHVTCAGCLAGHVRARIEEADINGLVCPWPSCKVEVSDALATQLLRTEAEQSTGVPGGDGPSETVALMLARLGALRAQAFVRTAKGVSWCPRPGCGHAVASEPRVGRHGRSACPVVKCSCGMRFCPQCHEIGGHEPADCQQLRSWREEMAQRGKGDPDADAAWFAANTQSCPKCSTKISRNGGCNHMICGSCGAHFCYVCGGDWKAHYGAARGLDYYRCRLGAQETRQDAPDRPPPPEQGSFESCHNSFVANTRDATWERGVSGLAIALAEAFDLDPALGDFVAEAVEASLEARHALQFSYVVKYQIGEEGRKSRVWATRLSPCISELEVVCAKLESTTGLSLVGTAARAAGRSTASALGHDPRGCLEGMDLRELLARMVAVGSHLAFASQLCVAVRLQTQRLLSEGRAFHELSDEERREPAPPGFLGIWNTALPARDGGLDLLGSMARWLLGRLVGGGHASAQRSA